MEQEIIRLLDEDLEYTSCLLKTEAVQASKSSICVLLKNMPEIVDKSCVKKVCVDDFAFRKRYTYGTVMVDLDTHRIIDLLDSRETKQVENWLLTYPNLEIISRDGAQAYASAAAHSHPKALQVSDRFHLLKNLSDSIEKYLYRLFPSRLSTPAGSQSLEWQALYDTRNRGEPSCILSIRLSILRVLLISFVIYQ